MAGTGTQYHHKTDYDNNKQYNKNVDKYCWYPTNNIPCGDWKGEGGHGYDNCGPKCKRVYWDTYSCDINGGGYNTINTVN